MNIYAKEGDKVVFLGSDKEVNKWGSCDSPNGLLVIGNAYTVSHTEVHSDHTKVFLKEVNGGFNSVLFDDVCRNTGSNDNSIEWLEERKFYELMQAYRHAPVTDQKAVCAAFEAVKQIIRDKLGLLPCPFCGNNAYISQDQSSDYESHWTWHVDCTGCGASIDYMTTKQQAIFGV